VTALWGNDADVPAQKALWLASPASDGKNGRMVSVLTPGFMLQRMFSFALRWIIRRPVALMDLNISSVQPPMELAPIYIEERK
jgi:hypothetical protein